MLAPTENIEYLRKLIDIALGISGEHRSSEDHFTVNTPHRPQVYRRRVVPSAKTELGALVETCNHLRGQGSRCALKHREAKISNLDVIIATEKQILRL